LKEDDAVIEAQTSFLVVRVMRDGQTILFASGRYIDRVLVQSPPVFAEKIVVCDSSRIDTLLAIPL
jgi:anthranilate 1,2-dioxygenase small subunit